jgi:hypothetical protein
MAPEQLAISVPDHLGFHKQVLEPPLGWFARESVEPDEPSLVLEHIDRVRAHLLQ